MKKSRLKAICAASCAASLMAMAGYAIGQDSPGAVARLMGLDGSELGEVRFTQVPHGLLLKADLKNLPAGTQAFHLHTTGACSPDFKAAGGHLNPTDKKHGYLSDGGPHLGDMPNIHVPDSGSLTFEYYLPELSISGAGHKLMDEDGTAVVIHQGPDDYKTDPAGAAGDRIACGVVETR